MMVDNLLARSLLERAVDTRNDAVIVNGRTPRTRSQPSFECLPDVGHVVWRYGEEGVLLLEVEFVDHSLRAEGAVAEYGW